MEKRIQLNEAQLKTVIKEAIAEEMNAKFNQGIAERAEDPGGRADQPDGRGLGGTEPADHRRVDVAHQAHRELREDGRPRKQEGELELLTPAHRFS